MEFPTLSLSLLEEEEGIPCATTITEIRSTVRLALPPRLDAYLSCPQSVLRVSKKTVKLNCSVDNTETKHGRSETSVPK